MRFPFQVDFPSARIFTFGWLLSKPGTGKKPARQPHPRTVFRRSKGRERTPETPKSGKSGPLYAKKGETHNNTGFCSFLYFFSRIRTYVLDLGEKNLYISPPKPGTVPNAWEKKCNKLVTLQNRSVADKPPRQRPDRFGFGKRRRFRPCREDSPQPDTAKKQGWEAKASRPYPMPAGMAATAILTGTRWRILPDLRRRIAMERGQPYSPPCARRP